MEEFIDGEWKVSPSVQCRINPLGISGCHLYTRPGHGRRKRSGISRRHISASGEYNRDIAALGLRICRGTTGTGVLGRFSIDFYRLEKLVVGSIMPLK